MNRADDIEQYYDLLNQLELKLGGKRKLSDCDGRMDWPKRGVYIFFDSPGVRQDSRTRVVRIGTHALKSGSNRTLWERLSQHKGVAKSGGGNHRGSIFRLLVRNALIHSGKHVPIQSWGLEQDHGKAAKELGIDKDLVKSEEFPLEVAVSQYIGNMPFLWLRIEDEPGPESLRGIIERNSIALLSQFDVPRAPLTHVDWLGSFSDRERVQRSRLWNNNHVYESYDAEFLKLFERLIQSQ